jgi:hypothetical protein
MECTFFEHCGGAGCRYDEKTKLAFASEECLEKYYLIKRDVEEATSFDPDLFRLLWLLHVALTRQVILSLVLQPSKKEEIDARIKALMANQADLGKEIGLEAGDSGFGVAATHLLETHIAQSKDLLDAYILGRPDYELDVLFAKWAQNGRDISGAVGGKLFPHNRPAREELEREMFRHLSLTYSEMRYTVEGEKEESRSYYREVVKCIILMSDLISSAVVAAKESPKVLMMHPYNGRNVK